MRILHVSSEYPPQKVFGLGRFAYDLSGAQATAGDEVCVVTNSLSGDRHDTMERGVRVCRVDWPPPPKPAEESATVMQFNVQLFERAAPIIAKWRPDVINVHDWLTASVGKALKQLYGIPLVVTIHDTVVGKRFGELDNEHRFIGRLEHWICRVADRVICCSGMVRDELVSGAYKAAPEKVDVIPCGVDAAAFEIDPKPGHLAAFRRVLAAPDEPIVLYVGRLDTEKGLEVLMNALPAVLARQPKAKFVLAGRGKMESSLHEHLKKNNLLDRVFFAGYVRPPALAHLYRVADIQIVPSTYEPFGIVALEGMVCGKPVVASNTGGLSEIVEHGKTGLLFKPGSHEELSKCVCALLADGGKRAAYGAAGRRRAVEAFNWARVAAMTRSSYQAACGLAPAPLPEARPARAGRRSGRRRVLFDCQQLSEQMTGVGYYTERVLGEMLGLGEGFDWVLLCHSGNARMVEERAEGLAHVSTVVLRKPVPLDYRVQQDMLSRIIPEQGIDLYFSPSFLSVPRDLCPSISVVHDATFEHYPEFHPPGVAAYLHRCVEDTCRNAERVITISENSKADIARFYGYPAERIVVTPLAADEDFFRSRRGRELKEARGRYGLPERYVLAVNMGSPKKNVATLLGAWARLPEGLRAAFKLAVVGEWSPSSVDIPRLVKERGIEGSVAVTGYVPREDLFFLYAGATLFCFPSLHEGFGLPVLEAMASGVPVITSNAASLPEVAADAAVLLDPGDEAGWAAAMERLLGSEKERTRLAKEGRWRANQFRWEQTAEATLGVIDEVLKSSRRRGKGAGASAGRARVVSPRMTAPAGAGRRFEPVPLGGLALAVTVDDVRPEPGFGGGREKDPLGYLLRLHKEFGVKSTLFVPTNWQGKWPVEGHLDWLKWLLGQPCFEVACHGHLHAAGDGANAEFKGLSPERLEGVLAESLRVFGMAGHRPAGVKAPGWSLEPSAYEVFAGRFDYVADHVQGVEASCLAGAKLLRLPYLYTIDEMGAWPEKGLVVLQSHVAPEGATTNGWCEGLYERVRAFVRTGKRLGARFVTLGELARELKGALPETPRAPRPVPAAIVATASDPRLRGGEVKVLGAEAGVLYNASGAPCPLELKAENAGIAILSRNRRGYLAELLKSIDETGPKELGRVVLLNNCEDDSAKHLADRFPNWRVVELNDRDYPDVPAGLVWLKEHCSGLLPGPVDKLGPAMGWTAPRSIGWLTNELFCRCGRDFLVKFDDDFVVKPGWWEYYVRFQREYGAHAVMNNFGAFAMCRTVPGMIGWVDERFLGSHGHEDNDYAARMMEGRVRWVLGFNREHDWRSAEEGNPRGSMTGADCFIHRYALAGGGYSARRDEAMRDPVRAAWNSRWFAAKWEETEEDTGVFARPPFKGKFLRRKVAEEPDWRPGGLPDAAPAAAGVKVSENTPVSEIDLVANPATGTMVDRYALLAHWCKGKRVLDAGCGYGYGSSILLALGAESVVGADADAAALAYAESHYAGPRISFKAYDLADGEPGALGWFGVVVSVETLEHLPREKAERYLAGLRAHAEPGGVVIVTTPRRAEAEWRYRGGTHRYEYSAGEFADLVAKAFPGAETSFMDIEEFRVQGEARLYSRLTPAIDDRTRVMVAVARGVR